MLILASRSPRRSRLLREAGIPFEVLPADIEERRLPGEEPEPFARRLAREKALAVASRVAAAEPRVVLGSDTIVVLEDSVLGKPSDAADACRLLGRLVGRRHQVVTAVAVVATPAGRVEEAAVVSDVEMRPASDAEIEAYVATGEPLDKAGAYALQGRGRSFVRAVRGSESNVIGLPVEETLALLASFGVHPQATP